VNLLVLEKMDTISAIRLIMNNVEINPIPMNPLAEIYPEIKLRTTPLAKVEYTLAK
jgi:hypothetical protein